MLGPAEWGGVGDMGGLTPISSPHYSPEPNSYQGGNSNPLDIDLVSVSAYYVGCFEVIYYLRLS